jgi:hypothetical protein
MSDLHNLEDSVVIDNKTYQIEKLIRTEQDPLKTHLLIPALILNQQGLDLIKTCVASFLHFSADEVEIWVIDNHSPQSFADRLKAEIDPGVNLLLNRTEPQNPFYKLGLLSRLNQFRVGSLNGRHKQMVDGSYANGVGLEIGRGFLPRATKTVFTAHSDTCATHRHWLKQYKAKLSPQTPAVGGYSDKARIHALHISSMLIDYQWMLQAKENFMPNMRQERFTGRPEYDVGDSITWRLHQDKLNAFVLPNTQNSPELVDQISSTHPLKHVGTSPRVFGDDGEIIFMHLGRGTVKAIGAYKQKNKFTAIEWIETVQDFLKKSRSE